jgi:hypothetical protein
MSIDKDPTPRVLFSHLKGKAHVTRINLSQESSEVLMFALAEMMGFKIVELNQTKNGA